LTGRGSGRDGVGHDPRPGLRRLWLRRLQASLHWSGVASLYARSVEGHPAVILMYHSVCPSSHERWIAPRNRMSVPCFTAQMRFLARTRRVVSLDELLERLADRRPLPPRTVLLTFDDGYLDNLTVAAPILAHYRLPATLYLATGYVERTQGQWADELYAALRGRTRDRLCLAGHTDIDLSAPARRTATYRCLVDRLRVADLAGRTALLREVTEQLAPAELPPRTTLSWDDVRRLDREHPHVRLGIHTRDHLDLTAMSSAAAEQEIVHSVRDFESHLGRAPADFSFPYARSSESLIQQVEELGLRSAAAGSGVALGSSNPLALPRLEAPSSRGLLGYWTSGAHPQLSLRLLGRE